MAPSSGTSEVTAAPTPGRQERLRFSAFSVVRAVLVVVAYLMALAIVRAASTPLWWLAIASALAALLQPALLYLRRYVPGWLALLLVVVAVVGIGGFLSYRGVAELRNQVEVLRDNAVRSAQEIQTSKQYGEVATEFGLADKTRSFFENLPFQVSGTGDAAETVQSAASSGGALFAIGMLTLLMLIFGRRLLRSAIAQVGEPTIERRLRTLVATSYRQCSAYAWFMILRSVAIGLLAAGLAALQGFDAPTAVGVWFAVLSLLPGLGIVLAALPLVGLEAVSSVPSAIALAVLALGLQVFDVMLLQRRIEARSLRVGPGLTLVGALVGLQLYGVGGVLVVLAVVIFGLAAIRVLTRDQPDVFTATRALLAPEPA